MISTNFIKRTTSILLLSVMFFTSCTKDDSVQPQSPLLLTEFKSGDDITRFEYSADGKLHKIILNEDPITGIDNVTYTVKYLSNNKIDELQGSNGAKIKLSYVINILAKTEVFMGQTKFLESQFAYNGNQLSSAELFTILNNNNIPLAKSNFIYNSTNNVSRTNMFLGNPNNNQFRQAGYVLYQYDNKINPFASLGEVALIFWEQASTNNTIKQEYFDETGAVDEVKETTYTYNAQGYPISGLTTEKVQGQQPTTVNIHYTYKQ